MKTLVFSPGKVGSLVRYLPYLFLRFPGSLGDERRGSRRCQIWVRTGASPSQELVLVQPPSRWALALEAPRGG